MADDRPQASQDSDFSEDSDLELGNQELVLTSPSITQCFLNEEAPVRQYYLDETARARAAWSSLDLCPRKCLPFISTLEPFVESKPSSRSSQRACSEPGSDSDFDSPPYRPAHQTWKRSIRHRNK